jgi:hypothetical protein
MNVCQDITIFFSMALQPFGPWPLFSFLILYRVSRTPLMGDQHIARQLPTQRTTQTQNKCTQIATPPVRFEPIIPVFKQAKTVHLSKSTNHAQRCLTSGIEREPLYSTWYGHWQILPYNMQNVTKHGIQSKDWLVRNLFAHTWPLLAA